MIRNVRNIRGGGDYLYLLYLLLVAGLVCSFVFIPNTKVLSASEYIEVPFMAEFSHTSTRYENGKPTTTSYYYNYYLGSPADGYFLWQEDRETGNISYASDSPFRRYLLGITPADGASYAHATTTIRNGRGEYERFSYQNGVLTFHCFGNGENKAYQYFKPECIRSVTDTAITFKDVTGDGKPDVIFNWEGYYEPPYFSATPTRFMALTSFPESEVEGASFAYLAMLEAKKARETVSTIENSIKTIPTNLEVLKNKITQLQNDSISKEDISNLQNIVNNLQLDISPTITSIKGANNATATKYSYIDLDVSVSNATHYKIKGGAWQPYVDVIRIEGIKKGLNKIEIEFGNFTESDGVLKGSTCKGVINIFGL